MAILDSMMYYPISIIIWVVICAFITSTLHGMTGIAGGFLLSAALIPIIGIKPVIPIVSITLLFSHTTRILLNIRFVNLTVFTGIMISAFPFIGLFAILYGKMASPIIALVLALMVLVSIPARRFTQKYHCKTKFPTLIGIGCIYGVFAGMTIGPGIILVPFLLGYGLKKREFIATLAMIALCANIIRIFAFYRTELLNSEFIFLGLISGFVTIIGNFVGRQFLHKMTSKMHIYCIDVLTIIAGLNILWFVFKSI